jgi:hypothetical protein
VDCRALVLQVHQRSAGAIAMYKKLGFRITGILKDYYCTGSVSNYGDGLQMAKSLQDRCVGDGDAKGLGLGVLGLGLGLGLADEAMLTRSPSSVAMQTKAQKRNQRRAQNRAARNK